MVQKFVFGQPVDTEAVVNTRNVKTQEYIKPGKEGKLPHFSVKWGEKGEIILSCRMGGADIVYGLGENVRGINKRGWLYESNCSDDPNHSEEKRSLYGAHNFFILDGQRAGGSGHRFGVFADAAQKVTFDCGYTDSEELTVTAAEGGFVLYLLEDGSLREIVKDFRQLTGPSYLPPRWAFGYGQSRWGYQTADEVREIVRRHREGGLPLDSVYLDIDYMERYKDFTVDEEKFPDFPEFVKEMKAEHIHLVPIIDAGVKIEEGYPVYEEGLKNGYFCRREDGREFTGGVWPGRVHFPDVLNEEARKWFGDWYRVLLDQGIEGFWNDMNEPALFYEEEHLKEAQRKLSGADVDSMDIWGFFDFKGTALGIANRPEDYARMYHDMDGRKVCHERVHNLYGYYMTRAAAEAFERLRPDRRILMFSRSSCVGAHRYGGIWTGDNQSWWSHILLNLQMLPGLNMCGFLYCGADLGGFGSNTSEDLLLRWLELGIFTPLMRNHSALDTRPQEAYRFGRQEDFRNILRLRYGLLPYLYSEFMKAALNDGMLFQPLSFVYPEDGFAPRVEDQLMVGESLMIAPVYRQNAEGRYVYLPEEMKLYRFRSLDSMDVEILPAGHHYVNAALNEVLVFVRPDHLAPLSYGGEYAAAVDSSRLQLLHFIKTEAVYELYDDDGYTKHVELEGNMTKISVDQTGDITVKGARQPDCRLL